MILVWSSENGGPLQTVGLILFLLQIIGQIAPHFLDGSAFVQLLMRDTSFIVLILLVAIVIGMVGFAGVMMLSDYPPVVEEEEEGTAANPVDVDARDDSRSNNNNDTANSNNANDGNANSRIINYIRRIAENFNSHYLMLTSAFILPLSMVIPILINVGGSGIMSSTVGTISLAAIALAAHACMAFAAYGVLREYLSGGAGVFPGNRRNNDTTSRVKQYTVVEMADIVRKIPVEEYVSMEDIRGGECSVSKLKRMLRHRGAGDAIADQYCLEKEDLMNELCRVRKHEGECTICSEDYAEG
eukprot:scaffold11039_cov21-Cyclotella_meneghiniana.AAC.1